MTAAKVHTRVQRLHVEIAGAVRLVTVEPVADDSSQVLVSWGDTSYVVDARPRAGGLTLAMPRGPWACREVTCHASAPGEVLLGLDGRQVRARVGDGRRGRTAAAGVAGDSAIVAPMPGRVVRVTVKTGDLVTAGQGVAAVALARTGGTGRVAVEAMKMENELTSPVDGIVSDVRVAVGDSVESGAVLVVVSADAPDVPTP